MQDVVLPGLPGFGDKRPLRTVRSPPVEAGGAAGPLAAQVYL